MPPLRPRRDAIGILEAHEEKLRRLETGVGLEVGGGGGVTSYVAAALAPDPTNLSYGPRRLRHQQQDDEARAWHVFDGEGDAGLGGIVLPTDGLYLAVFTILASSPTDNGRPIPGEYDLIALLALTAADGGFDHAYQQGGTAPFHAVSVAGFFRATAGQRIDGFLNGAGDSSEVEVSGYNAAKLVVVGFADGGGGGSAGGGAAGAGGHVVVDELADLPARARLAFMGAGVTVTDDPAGGRTVVTVPSGQIGPPGDPGPAGEPGPPGEPGVGAGHGRLRVRGPFDPTATYYNGDLVLVNGYWHRATGVIAAGGSAPA